MHYLLNVSQKIDGTTIDDTEDLDLIMPMYNLIEYSSNYSKTGRFYLKSEVTNFNADITNNNNNFKPWNVRLNY